MAFNKVQEITIYQFPAIQKKAPQKTEEPFIFKTPMLVPGFA